MEAAKVLALVMIVTTMCSGGLQLKFSSLREVLRDYSLLGKALLLNFVLLPMFAFVLLRYFSVNPEIAIGILLMAMAPGVPFLVNTAGAKQGGSLEFALTIAFLFSTISVVTIPITAALLLPAGALAHVPMQSFLATLVAFQLLPLVIGAVLSSRLPGPLVQKAVKVLNGAFFVAGGAFIVLLFPKISASVGAVYGFGHLAIIAIIGVFALGVGWICGGPDRQSRRTLSIAALLRNIGLCSLIGTGSFAGTLVTPAIIAYFIVTFVLSIPFQLYYKRTALAAASV